MAHDPVMRDAGTSRADQAREIFLDAIESRDEPTRAALLTSACGTDRPLREAVERLLTDYFGNTDFMAGPAVRELTANASPESVGPYKILRKLGEGGSGVVYLAEQVKGVRRTVALKVLKAGMDTQSVIARFEAERQALAIMNHPSIAKVFDAGSTETGRPYFVMELVEGVPITEHCARNNLSTHDRLILFLKVCDAVQHAHQKGIIHRDLKPSNILVTTAEGNPGGGANPIPKIIDFGIAKAVAGRLTDNTVFTAVNQFIGTPAYMSPEQALITSEDIDTRSDIYSLGVLLYELLTGRPPFDNHELLTAGLDEMRRIIREDEPQRPSARLPLPSLTERTCASTAPAVDADLDWIVMKCLEKDRSRRYSTASELAADLQRHLSNEPVTARPPSTVYRLKKFARRNKVLLSFAAALAALLVSSIFLVSWQAIRATRAERAEARQRLRAERRYQATVNILSNGFWKISPYFSDLIGAAKPREELALAAMSMIAELQQDSDPSPEFNRMLGRLYFELAGIQAWWGGNTMGDYEAGLNSVLQAIKLLTPDDPSKVDNNTLETMSHAYMLAGFAAQGLLRNEEAINYFREMEKWATYMTQRTNTQAAETGATVQAWAQGCMANLLYETGQTEEVLTNYYLPRLARMQAKNIDTNTAPEMVIIELGPAYSAVGLALARLDRHGEALPYLRYSLSLLPVYLERAPNSAQALTGGFIFLAAAAKPFLALGDSSEGLSLLRQAMEGAERLPFRDPANVGFRQAIIEVLQHHASAYVAWAARESDTISDRLQRLARAREYLDQAESRVAKLKSLSLQRYLRHHLARVESDRKREEGKLLTMQATGGARQ